MRPRVLVLAGLEPSGMAGLLADLAAVDWLGGRGLGVATALTAQGGRFLCRPVPPTVVRAQISALQSTGPIHAVKLGMVPTRQVLKSIRQALHGVKAPWVVDPVVRTSQKERLSSLSRRDYLALASPQVVLTPNLDEAGWLLGTRRALRTVEAAERAGRALLDAGFGAVVVKGGHLPHRPVDVVCTPQGSLLLGATRLQGRTRAYRGTGCRFASVMAVTLARGEEVSTAAKLAKAQVRKFLRRSILGARHRAESS
ncbi:MAG: bifunctional hydroxymethylpyrimidine kinase/phosphomethylpyrimidine kinase [Myxococcota bacterium]